MFKQQSSPLLLLLLLISISLLVCVRSDNYEKCLTDNNVTLSEFANIRSFENIPKMLQGNVELKYKCVLDCWIERDWDFDPADYRRDLKLLNYTSEETEIISKCMKDAPDEQCEYSFQLFMCIYKEDLLSFEDDENDDDELDVFDLCLIEHNITESEYEDFMSVTNIPKLLHGKVEMKHKCNIDCWLQRESLNWLNEDGRMDLKLMNTTSEQSESITKCMVDAPKEQCEYSFKLFMCAYLSEYPVFASDDEEDEAE